MAPATWTTDDGVIAITMDDGKANVINRAMLDALHTGLDAAEEANVPLVLAGRDGVFCGGFDLSVLRSMTPEAAELPTAGFELAYRMLAFPTPIVIACTGHAVAMGAFLLLSGDHRIGRAGAGHRIVTNEVAIGLTMPRSAIEVTRQRLTPAAVQQALNLAATFHPDTAVSAGFLDAVADDVVGAAREAASAFATLHRGAHRNTKRRVREQALAALRAAITADAEELANLGASLER